MREYTVILVYRNRYNEVLLQLKNRGPVFNIGKWNGIGGKLDGGESPRSGALREAFEEAGISEESFEFFECLCIQKFPVSAVTENAVHLHVFYGLLKDGVEVRQIEDEFLQWFESDTLLDMYYKLAGFGNLMHWHESIVSHYLRGEI